MMTPANKQYGFSIVELMISISIAALMSVAVMQLFVSEANHIRQESHRDLAAVETQALFETLSRLLRMAEADSIQIISPTQVNDTLSSENDSLDIRFRIPANYRIWPNNSADSNGLYNENEIRLLWQNDGQQAIEDLTLYIANAQPGEVDSAALVPLNNSSTEIINIDIWPVERNGEPASRADTSVKDGLLLQLAARSPGEDPAYVNPLDTNGTYRHIRTHQASTIIAPRN